MQTDALLTGQARNRPASGTRQDSGLFRQFYAFSFSSGCHFQSPPSLVEYSVGSQLLAPLICSKKPMFQATTVLSVRHRDEAVMASDGQVTFGATVVKHNARKIRRLYNDRILAGFAGSAADSFALFSRFEAKLEQYRGNLERSAVELAKDWRTDRMLRRLEAMLIVMDAKTTYLLSGTGDLIEPDDGIIAIGSGGAFAMAAAKALARHTEISARQIAEESMRIAASICIYSNDTISIESL